MANCLTRLLKHLERLASILKLDISKEFKKIYILTMTIFFYPLNRSIKYIKCTHDKVNTAQREQAFVYVDYFVT